MSSFLRSKVTSGAVHIVELRTGDKEGASVSGFLGGFGEHHKIVIGLFVVKKSRDGVFFAVSGQNAVGFVLFHETFPVGFDPVPGLFCPGEYVIGLRPLGKIIFPDDFRHRIPRGLYF